MIERRSWLLRILTLVLSAIGVALIVFALRPAGRDASMRERDIQAELKTAPIVLAFMGETLEQGLSAVLGELGGNVNVVSPHWVRFNADGTFVTKHGSMVFIAAAHEAHMQVWPLVSYAGPYGSSAGCPAVLCESSVRDRFVEELAQWATILNVEGLVLDVENVSANAKNDLVRLTEQLTAAMHQQQRQLWAAVFPQADFSPTLSGFHDVTALGGIADGIILMTYDQHSPYTGPGPIAAYDWVECNVADIVRRVPPHRVVLGLAGYGYRWTKQGDRWRTSVVTTHNMEQQAMPTQQASDTVQVWWESTENAVGKISLVQQYRLRGVAVWRHGLAHPNLWPALRQALAPDAR
ncbi:MAG: glycosyl hydrolase family 18 protein [Limnochordia bacterium]